MEVSKIYLTVIFLIFLTQLTNSLNEPCVHRQLQKNGTCIYYGNCAKKKLTLNDRLLPQFCGRDQQGYLIVCCPNEDKETTNTISKAEQKCNEYRMLYQKLRGKAKRSPHDWYHDGDHEDFWGPPHDSDYDHWEEHPHHEHWDHEHDWNHSPDEDSEYPTYSYDDMFRWREYSNYKTIDWGNDEYDEEATDNIPNTNNTNIPNNISNNTDGETFPMVSAIGGVDAEDGQFPHMVALGYGNRNSITWGCGGTLISERFILTAAHCTAPILLGRVRYVQMGTIKLNSSNKLYYVRRKYVHKDYKSQFFYNDIALIQISKPVEFTRNIIPACLYVDKENRDEFKDYSVNALGWGITGNGTVAEILQTVDLQYFDKCAQRIKREKVLPMGVNENTQICYGHKSEEKDTCKGDSGGPLNYFNDTFKVIGITSFGKNCGVINVPAVYTRVSYFIEWIESIVW